MTNKVHTVGDVISLVRRPVAVDPAEEYGEVGIKSFGRGVFHKEPASGFEIGNKRIFRIRAGDLLISNVFAWEGAVALASSTEEGLVGSHRFLTFQVNAELADPRYLASYFYGGPGLEVIRNASPGSAGRNRTLGIKTFASQEISLPSLEEQRRIADKMDALMRRVDKIIKLRARMEGIRSSLAESLLDSAVASKSTSVRVGDILILSRTPIDIEADGTYRVIGMRSFGKGVIKYPPIPGGEVSKLSHFNFPAEALVLSNIKAWEGAIGVTSVGESEEFVASNRFLMYIPRDNRVNTSYMRHYFLSRRGLAQVGAASPGGTDRNRTLGRKRFEALTIPLPPRPVQDRIASTLDRLAERQNGTYTDPSLAALRPSILNAAFTGQL